jgi:HAD superfamily hydrolase (TIGR01549 family)
MIRGVVFDLDGTLVDSQLDFDAMRREMELPANQPILESLGQLPAAHAERCHVILHRHELAGAERATVLPGVRELVAALHQRGVRQAIATRNSRRITEATLARLDLPFDLLLTRDDGPVKPDPWPVLEAARRWMITPAEIVVVGDFRFDVECGRTAGSRTVFLTHSSDPSEYPNEEQADLVLRSLSDYRVLLDFLYQ